MANPQPEDGHIDIANGIAEALCRTNLSPYESQVLWFVFRKTYGWHKSVDHIPLSQISAATRIAKPNILRTLRSLVRRRIITRQGSLVGFQKDYDLWLPEARRCPVSDPASALPPSSPQTHPSLTFPRTRESAGPSEETSLSPRTPSSRQTTLSPQITPVISGDNKPLSPQIPSKETTKETHQKKRRAPSPGKRATDPRVTQIMAAISSRVGYSIPFYAKEAAAVKRALGTYSLEQFLACWGELNKSPFWQGKWLPLTQVVQNLGEFTKGRLRNAPTRNGTPLPTRYTRPEDVEQD